MVTFSTPDESRHVTDLLADAPRDYQIVSTGKVLHMRFQNQIELSSFNAVNAAIEKQVRQFGKICILYEIFECDGWSAGALYQDDRMNFQMAAIDPQRLDEAKQWLAGGPATHPRWNAPSG